ncbi:hypothetical protein [Streptomyces goshikiensis]|uniref:hypothetical protein n=1 Tax=Streptomyces goshikiensis TaxID=1942 RepID=UPI0037245DA9
MPDLPPHDVDICPECDGLRLHHWRQVEGAQSITYESGGFSFTSDETYLFVVQPDPCDKNPEETP